MLGLISLAGALVLVKGPAALPPNCVVLSDKVVSCNFSGASFKTMVSLYNRLQPYPRFVFTGGTGEKRFVGTINIASFRSIVVVFGTYPDVRWWKQGDAVIVAPWPPPSEG